MRLWHPLFVPFLPTSQLSSQWRELNSIFKKQDNHILINYIYEYDKQTLYNYTQLVLFEMKKRNYNIKAWENYNNYFSDCDYTITDSMFNEHGDSKKDFEHLQWCFYNLKEKFVRGQKDFTQENYRNIEKVYKNEVMKIIEKNKNLSVLELTDIIL